MGIISGSPMKQHTPRRLSLADIGRHGARLASIKLLSGCMKSGTIESKGEETSSESRS